MKFRILKRPAKAAVGVVWALWCVCSSLAQSPGSVLWTFQTFGQVVSSLAIAPDGTIYAAGYYLYAFRPDGTNKWSVPVGANHSSPAVAPDGTVYVGSFVDGKLYAINPKGSTNWTFGTASAVESSPAIGYDGTIYFGSTDGKLYALRPDGTKRWELSTGQIGRASPSIAPDGTIYVGTQTNRLYAVRPDGTEKWTFDMPNAVETPPAVGADGTVYCTFQCYQPACPRGLIALSAAGAERWRSTSYTPFSAPVIGKDGTIYAVQFTICRLLSLDPSDGNLKWQAGGDSSFNLDLPGAPAVAGNGVVYYGPLSNNGEATFYAMNQDGTTNWTLFIGGSIRGAPTIGRDGTIYFAAANLIYAVAGVAPLADSPWPKQMQNPRNTGKVEKPSLEKPQKRADANFQFEIYGQLGSTNTVQASPDLFSWLSLTDVVVTNVPMDFTDLTASNYSSRFYRTLQQ